MTGLFTQVAVKEQLKARIAIDGPTGGGKTWTALQWAVVLAGGPRSLGGQPIGLVDTENRSAAYYAPTPGDDVNRINPWDPPYEFFHLPASAPYDPRWLTQIIHRAHEDLGDDGVLVIDSLTHFWSGEGGTMDIVDDAKSRNGGNSFAGWKEGTPAQRSLLDAIVHCRCHVIVTMRSKMEYVLEETVDSRGRTSTKPVKIGLAPEQRNGVEYEFTVVADIDLEHRLIVSKSRCDLIADLVMPKGRSAEVAQTFAKWLGSGVERISADDAAALSEMFSHPLVDDDDRKALKTAFVNVFGRPNELLTDQLGAACAWVTERVERIVGPPTPTAAAPEASATAQQPEPAAESEPTEPVSSLERLNAAMEPGEPVTLELDPPAAPVPGAEYGDVGPIDDSRDPDDPGPGDTAPRTTTRARGGR